MPSYTYRCKTCQMTHTHIQSMNDSLCPPCPKCGSFSERITLEAPPMIKAEKSEVPDKPQTTTKPRCALYHPHNSPCHHA